MSQSELRDYDVPITLTRLHKCVLWAPGRNARRRRQSPLAGVAIGRRKGGEKKRKKRKEKKEGKGECLRGLEIPLPLFESPWQHLCKQINLSRSSSTDIVFLRQLQTRPGAGRGRCLHKYHTVRCAVR